MKPTGLDQSWGYADPKTAAKAGVQVVSMYLSWDQSKNVTAKDVKAYHKAGIGMMLNWESLQGAPLAGQAQATSDATEAVRLARQLVKDVGYAPAGPLVIYFSCDRDVNAGQFGTIFAYYREARRICHAAGFGVGCYGEASLVSTLAKAKITDAEWQTYAWSGGEMSPDADFYQYLNGQQLGGASVDLDQIIHRDQLGAWWPPGSKPNPTEIDMPLSAQDVQKVAAASAAATVHALLSFRVPDPNDPKKDYPLLSVWWYANRFALEASKGAPVSIDTQAIADDIHKRLLADLGGNQ